MAAAESLLARAHVQLRRMVVVGLILMLVAVVGGAAQARTPVLVASGCP